MKCYCCDFVKPKHLFYQALFQTELCASLEKRFTVDLHSIIWQNQNITVSSHEHHDISSHRQFDGLFNNEFGLTAKKISIIRITGLLWGRPTGDCHLPERGQLNIMQDSFPCHDAIIRYDTGGQWKELVYKNIHVSHEINSLWNVFFGMILWLCAAPIN